MAKSSNGLVAPASSKPVKLIRTSLHLFGVHRTAGGFAYPWLARRLERRALIWDRFCFSSGEAIRQEGRAGRCGASAKRHDEPGVRRTETRKGRARLPQFLRLSSRPYAGTAFAESLDLEPNRLRQNGSKYAPDALAIAHRTAA
jgi:hypothetical protein